MALNAISFLVDVKPRAPVRSCQILKPWDISLDLKKILKVCDILAC